jgi:hypothetical protein
MSSLVSLPCTSHRSCAYHQYRMAPSLSNPSSIINTPVINPIAVPTSTTTTGTIRNPDAKVVPFQTLPTELILAILSYLTPTEQTCLALTCKGFASIIGPMSWVLTSKAKGAGLRRHDEIMDLLQKDLDEEYWRCTDCELFHPRVKIQQRVAKRNSQTIVLNQFFRGKENGKESELRLGIKHDPLYILTFSLVEAIMSRHFLSPPSGLCLNALKCRGSRSFTLSPITDVILDYIFTSKIVVDRLLLHAAYTFRRHRTMFVSNMPVSEQSLQEFLVSLPFQLCKHRKIASVFTKLRCPYCPTQWVIHGDRRHEIHVSVYQNLGEGRKEDTRWKFLTQSEGKPLRKYQWGNENVEEAFQRILCSTMEEFKKQLERSDGRGSWYDPILERPAYKTLPESLAMAL